MQATTSTMSNQLRTLLRPEQETPVTDVKVKFAIMERSADDKEKQSGGTAGNVAGTSSGIKMLYPVVKINGKYQYKCCACNRVFRQLSNLKAHWRTHSGERPHKCPKCQRPFVQRAHLQKHLPTHTAGKYLACYKCDSKFKKATSLAKHRRLHSKGKHHKCDSCEASFVEARHLLNHERRVHQAIQPASDAGERKQKESKIEFHCINCDKMYTSKGMLSLHYRRNVDCGRRWEEKRKLDAASGLEKLAGAQIKTEAVSGMGPVKQEMVAQPRNVVASHQNVKKQKQQQSSTKSTSSAPPPTRDPVLYRMIISQYCHGEEDEDQQVPQKKAPPGPPPPKYQIGRFQHKKIPKTEYLKQTLLGAVPTREYFFHNWHQEPPANLISAAAFGAAVAGPSHRQHNYQEMYWAQRSAGYQQPGQQQQQAWK